VPRRADDDGVLLCGKCVFDWLSDNGRRKMTYGRSKSYSTAAAPRVQDVAGCCLTLSKNQASLLLFHGRRGGCSIRRRTVHIVSAWLARAAPFCCRPARAKRSFDLSHLFPSLSLTCRTFFRPSQYRPVAGPCKIIDDDSDDVTSKGGRVVPACN
jgi:hypothetical protein